MKTVPITIEVDAQAATIYNTSSPQEQKRMQLLLNLRLRDLTLHPRRPLRQIMDEMAAGAESNGLTQEILESILGGEEE